MRESHRWSALFAALSIGVLLSGHAEAATITITDLTDGTPLVVVSPDFESPVVTLLAEFADVTGLLRPATSAVPLVIGTRFVQLLEPAVDPFGPRVSDIIRLVASAIGTDAGGPFQRETITLWSDGAAGFDAALALSAGSPTLLETGGPQDITALLGIGFPNQNLQVIVQSDIGGSEVPEPTTLSLVAIGVGLSARRLRGIRRR